MYYILKEFHTFRMSKDYQFASPLNAPANQTSGLDIQDLPIDWISRNSIKYDRGFELWMDQILRSPYKQGDQFMNTVKDNSLANTKVQKQKVELLKTKIVGEETEKHEGLNVEIDHCFDPMTPLDTRDSKKQEMINMEQEKPQGQSPSDNPEQPEMNVNQRTPPESTRSKKLKSYLICVQRCICTLQEHNLSLIENEDVQNFINSKNSHVTKKLFEKLCQDQEAKVILARIFKSQELHRQLQLSMMVSSNRQLFLSELNLLKKALITGRLPNL